jgi:hypothetical protein
MSKGIKRCAYIRTDKDGEKRCPFGLPITAACENAGESVTHMYPLSGVPEDRQEQVEKANKRVYIHGKSGERCEYAANIMKEMGAVNCNFGDHAQGIKPAAIEGSPLYPQTFAGIGLDGLYAFPLGFYADNNESRNLFHGLFSLVGEAAPGIIKQAILEGDKELWEKIERDEILLPQEQDRLNLILENCRREFEDCRTDPAKVKELVDRWNPRKNL